MNRKNTKYQNIIKSISTLYVCFLFTFFLFSCNFDKTTEANDFPDGDSLRIAKIRQKYYNTVYNNYDSSRVYYRLVLNEIAKLPPEKEYLAAYFLTYISNRECFVANTANADSLSKAALEIAYKFEHEPFYAYVHENRANYFWKISEFDSAYKHYTIAFKYAKKENWAEGIIVNKLNLVSIISETQPTDSTIKNFLEIIDLCKTYNDTFNICAVYNNLANLYSQKGHLHDAILYYQKSINGYTLCREENNILHPLANIADIYSRLGMDTLAIIHFKKAIDLGKKTKNYQVETMARSNLVDHYFKLGEFEKAEKLALSVVNDYRDNNYPHDKGLISAHNNLGGFYYGNKYIEKSKQHYLLAYHYALKLGFNFELAISTTSLANIYQKQNRADSSRYYLKIAKSLAEEYNYTNEIRQLSIIEAKLERAKGNYNKAFKKYDEFEELVYQFFDTISKQKIKDISYYHELQRNENEKKLLVKENELKNAELKTEQLKNKQNRIINLAAITIILLLLIIVFLVRLELKKKNQLNAILEEENAFKNSLFSIISHDIRSPVITMYNSFLLLKTKQLKPENKEKIENELIKRSTKTIDLIDNLLFWTRGQFKGEENRPVKFNLHQMVDHIQENELANRYLKSIQFVNNVNVNFEMESDKGLVRLLLRNLLSNAFKYTHNEGCISVNAQETETGYIVQVKDNGIGIDETKQEKLLKFDGITSVKGMHNEYGKGIGLSLCHYFISKQGGKIWFESVKDKGTIFSFLVPKK